MRAEPLSPLRSVGLPFYSGLTEDAGKMMSASNRSATLSVITLNEPLAYRSLEGEADLVECAGGNRRVANLSGALSCRFLCGNYYHLSSQAEYAADLLRAQ